MIRIEQTEDLEKIEEFLFDPDIRKALIPGDELKRGDRSILSWKSNFFLMLYDSILAGLCIIYPLSNELAGIHLGIKKSFRGKIGYEISEKMRDFLCSELKIMRLIARIRHENRKAIFFASQMGFKQFGGNQIYKYMEANYG